MAVDYVTFLLDLAGSGDNRAIQGTVAYRRTSAQPENAFIWKVTCDVRGKVIVVGFVDEDLEVIATARWHGKLAEHTYKSPGLPTTFQWELVEKALNAELERRELVLDRSREAPVSNSELIEDDPLGARIERAPMRMVQAPTVPVEKALPPNRPYIPTPRERKNRQKQAAIVLSGCSVMAVILIVQCVRSRTRQITNEAREKVARENAAREQTALHEAAMTPPSPPPPIAAPPAVEEPVEVRIARATTFADAIALARPAMADTTEELGAGAKQLATYAAAKLRWEDVAVEPETTIGHVLKDPAVERGKRMCTDGTIASIERRDLGPRKIYVGALSLADGDSIAFVAVGSTGELVKRRAARFCGAVTGKSGSSVAMVGMFDLPENRSPVVEQ